LCCARSRAVLELLCHPVERIGQHAQLVAALHRDAAIEVALRDFARPFGKRAQRLAQLFGKHDGKTQRRQQREQQRQGQRQTVQVLQRASE
jgi:hypothetical protein